MKKKIQIVLMLILFQFFCINCSKDEGEKNNVEKIASVSINCNGLYYYSNAVDDNYYLRFYSDSTVIDVSSTGNLTQVAKWFNRDKFGLAVGKYKVVKDSIIFVTTMPGYGDLNYSGLINNDRTEIDLEIYSPVNKKGSKHIFKFFPVIYN